MRYKLTHRTKYNYHGGVNTYHSLVCLQPRQLESQICRDFVLRISPTPAEVVSRIDYFGNTIHYFSIDVAHKELIVVAESDVESFAKPALDEAKSFSCQDAKNHIWQTRSVKVDLLQYLLASPFITWDESIMHFAQRFFSAEQSLYTCVKNLCHAIFTEFKFDSNFTTVHTPLQTVLKEKRGVCQDFSHLAIASLRSMGFPARYVSGYLETLPPPGKKKLQGSDASHAWVSVFIPPFGWCEFDPTNDMIPQERHIVTAYGRDYSDIAPLKGIIFSSGRHTLSVAVDVIPNGG